MRGSKRKHQELTDTEGASPGTRCFSRAMYLGVRVKMPVKEMLRKIRTAKGLDPSDMKERCGKGVKGDLKRVKSRHKHTKMKHQHPTQSLEELAIIIEVLEEDLRTSSRTSSSVSPNTFLSISPVPPHLSGAVAPLDCDEDDDMIPSPRSYTSSSLCAAGLHPVPPLTELYAHCSRHRRLQAAGEEALLDVQKTSAFFWMQLQREELLLSSISDSVLLATDGHGRTALHKAASAGKRVVGYALAQRMAAASRLDVRDSDGMTALLCAARNNQHLMVADLIHLGADVNVKNKSGKSCLHLGAENGFIRVLEAVKCAMMDGVDVDMEATDNAGMSVLQCAVLAMKATVRELEGSSRCTHTLHSLGQEQMMETVECLLQMDSYLHTTKGSRVRSL